MLKKIGHRKPFDILQDLLKQVHYTSTNYTMLSLPLQPGFCGIKGNKSSQYL